MREEEDHRGKGETQMTPPPGKQVSSTGHLTVLSLLNGGGGGGDGLEELYSVYNSKVL